MHRNKHRLAKGMIASSLYALLFLFLVAFMPILLVFLLTSREIFFLDTTMFVFLLSVISPLLSLMGYLVLINEEREVSRPNLIAVTSSLALILIWFALILMMYNIPTKIGFVPLLIMGLAAVYIWFGSLIERNRYLSTNMETNMT